MAEQIIRVPIAEENWLRGVVELMNNFFHLTKTEVDVLVAFIQFNDTIPCSTEARVYVMENLRLSSIAVINNHVKALKDKGAIKKQGKAYVYNPLLRSVSGRGPIVIKIEQKHG